MQWFERLDKHGYVEIHDFFDASQAQQLRRKVLLHHHFKKWNLLTSPYGPVASIKDRISINVIDNMRHRQATRALKRDQFSFSFYRSSNKHARYHGLGSVHQDVGKSVVACLKAKAQIKGELRDSFFAEFIKGQFISYHTDGSAGKYAFIYQLSQGWQPKYGGQLELYPRKIKFYKRSLQPKFNTLTILDLSHPMPHSVRMLNNPQYKHRITISGWVE